MPNKDSKIILFLNQLIIRLISLRKELFWVIFGQGLAFIGGFVGIKILTNAMGPQGYGQLTLGMTIAGIINMFLFGPIAMIIIRFFSIYREKNELSTYFYLLKKAHIICIAGLILLVSVLDVLIYLYFGLDWALMLIIASVFGIISGLNGSFSSLQSAIRQRKIVGLHQGLDSWLRPLFALLSIHLFINNGYCAVLGYIFGTSLITISQAFFAAKNPEINTNWNGTRLRSDKEKSAYRELFSYGSSFSTFAIFSAICLYSDRWILQGLFSEREVGIYAAIYQIANAPIAILVAVIGQLITPIMFEKAGTMNHSSQIKSTDRLLNLTIIITFLLMLGIVMTAFIESEFLITLLTTPDFAKYHHLLWIFILGINFFYIAQFLVIKGQNFKQPQIYVFAWIIRSLTFLIFGIIGAKYYGLLGLAWSFCFTSLLFLIAVYFANRRLSEKMSDSFKINMDDGIHENKNSTLPIAEI